MRVAGPVSPSEEPIVGQITAVARLLDTLRNGLSTEGAVDEPARTDRPHAAFTYESPQEHRDAIIENIRDGLRKGQLTVFVHTFETDAQALDFLHGRRLDKETLRQDESFLVTRYDRLFPATFRSIDHDATVEKIHELRDVAERNQKAGVHVVCDASASFIDSGRKESWLAFEEWWNRARPNGIELLCGYRNADACGGELKEIFESLHRSGTADVPTTEAPASLPPSV